MGRELRSAGKLTVNCGVWARAGKVASAAQRRRPRREENLGMRMSLARVLEVLSVGDNIARDGAQ